jgi:tRNA dimethylallyltransferase
MGATASGKTGLAVDLAQKFDCDIISVDSAMVYRGMDIGTAKPDAATLALAPHRLIDIRDPEDQYSAGDFRRDALQAIEEILAAGRTPLLVGGTMLYFQVLQHGIARLPGADPAIREELDERASRLGWQTLHAELAQIDPAAAAKIQPADAQRIQRALEVHRISGETITALQRRADTVALPYRISKYALWIDDRSVLHWRIRERMEKMLEAGFEEEVRGLAARPGLSRETPSMRAVGYRQMLDFVAGRCSLDQAISDAITATRRLAKRQYTWMRSQPDLRRLDMLEPGGTAPIYGEFEKA